MADKINAKQLGLTLATLAGAIHLIWVILIGLFGSSFQSALDWIFALHLLQPVYQITGFSWTSLVLLTILAFIGGYVSGYIIAWVYNQAGRCCGK